MLQAFYSVRSERQLMEQQGAQQFLRRDRWPPDLGIHGVELLRHILQSLVGHPANRPQRMGGAYACLRRKIAVHIGLLVIDSAHVKETFRAFDP